jgi:hypothetical protein
VFYAGGGGSGSGPFSVTQGPGGIGGGGTSSASGPIGTEGSPNTGGGGGGGAGSQSSGAFNSGLAGGSGIVILRYPSSKTITLGAGLTGTTETVGSDKVTTITQGTGDVSWA